MDLNVRWMPGQHVTAKFDLSFVMRESASGLLGHIEYATDLFERETVERLAQQLTRLLEGVVQDPQRRLSQLPLLSEAERQQLLVQWNDTARAYPAQSVAELFSAQAARTPSAVALMLEDQQLSYGQLEERSNQLAHYLVSLGVGPEVPVGLCLERSIEMIVGLLAILKAGGAYLPLDPNYPPERLAFMLSDAQVSVLLTHSSLQENLPAHWARVVELDSEWERIAKQSAEGLAPRAGADNLAYVIYTSGSTGKPKGVSVVHRNIVRLIKGDNAVAISCEDGVLQLAPLAFDASTFEIWGALLNGARLVLYPRELDLGRLRQVVAEGGVSAMWLTAGLFHSVVEQDLSSLTGVRTLLAGGDALSVPHVRQVVQGLTGTRLINGYGPTECTTFSTWQQVEQLEEQASTVPIGKPLANTSCYVLDEQQELVPIGVIGELYIGGEGVARGYLSRPALTGERFVPDPFAGAGARVYRTGDLVRWNRRGELEFIGRVDHQVKIRGFRIELGEVESVLLEHSQVAQAVVLAREDVPGEKRLVAYVVAALDEGSEEAVQALETAQLRSYLQQRLPEYMIPAAFVLLEQLPLTSNGKVDRQALPAPELHLGSLGEQAPRNPTEQPLAQIWSEVLRLERVGIHQNFFELGGHSLMATQVVAQIRELLRLELPLRSLFEIPTIASLAEHLERLRREQQGVVMPSLSARERGAVVELSSLPRSGCGSWSNWGWLAPPTTYRSPCS